jgi:ribosomal protein L37AE/L43A
MSGSQPYSSPKLFLLLFRLELLALLACFAAAGFAVAGVVNDTILPWVFTVAAAAGAGIILGFTSRLFFRRNSFPLRLTAAVSATLFSLMIMGWLTGGLVGADPTLPAERRPDWSALGLMVIGIAAATLSLAAWRKRPAPIDVSSLPVGEVIQEPQPPALPEKKIKSVPPVNTARPAGGRLGGILGFFRRARHNTEIRLTGAEKSKCPYCLQPIEARDPRGVVVCPICHTRHHKDCWDVTGMCQVPHYHA